MLVFHSAILSFLALWKEKHVFYLRVHTTDLNILTVWTSLTTAWVTCVVVVCNSERAAASSSASACCSGGMVLDKDEKHLSVSKVLLLSLSHQREVHASFLVIMTLHHKTDHYSFKCRAATTTWLSVNLSIMWLVYFIKFQKMLNNVSLSLNL